VLLDPERAAQLAHRAEVMEFGEPGGQMDHYSTALGSIIYLDFYPQLHFERIDTKLSHFVLGDSLEPKDTKSILSRVKDQMIAVVQNLGAVFSGFSLRDTRLEDINKFDSFLNSDQRQLLRGTLENYTITQKARQVLTQKTLDHLKFGELLNEHQRILRESLKISTPKIDRMIEAALDAGAYGAKINGSGGGGCMFAYAPDNPQAVREAVEKAGGKGYLIEADEGVRWEEVRNP
jgi:galactokinase